MIIGTFSNWGFFVRATCPFSSSLLGYRFLPLGPARDMSYYPPFEEEFKKQLAHENSHQSQQQLNESQILQVCGIRCWMDENYLESCFYGYGTFDQLAFESRLNEVKKTHPQTVEDVIPNKLVREILSKYCKSHVDDGDESSTHVDDVGILDKSHFDSLLAKLALSSPLSEQKQAAKELCNLTKDKTSFRGHISTGPEKIDWLLAPLATGGAPDPDLQENLISTVLNLSLYPGNKKLIAESSMAMPILQHSLRVGTAVTKKNATAALFSLGCLDENNKVIIGNIGALKRLLYLIEEGDLFAIMDVCVIVQREEITDTSREARTLLVDLMNYQLKNEKPPFGDDLLQFFVCPLSKKVMVDPVIMSTGQTFDRNAIELWLNKSNTTCPQTGEALSDERLIPNKLVREMISKFFKKQGNELPTRVDDGGIPEKNRFDLLLDKLALSSSLSEQKQAAKEFRKRTKDVPSFCEHLSDSPEKIAQLLTPLAREAPESHPDLHEDLISTVFNLSLSSDNKKLILESRVAMSLLLRSLRSGNAATKRNAAATMFSLACLDPRARITIGNAGALKPLIDLLKEEDLPTLIDASKAIFKLCFSYENKEMAVNDGAVEVIFKKLIDGVLVEELLGTLPLLSQHPLALSKISEVGAVSC